jgi:hypothetical protein
VLARIVRGLLLAFCGLIGVAALRYPGGTWIDRQARGFDWVDNYWCDLLHSPALNGQASGAPPFAIAGMTAMAVALAVFWWSVRTSFVRGSGAYAWVPPLGVLSSVGLGVLTLLPSNLWPLLHKATVLLAGPLGLAALVLALRQWARQKDRADALWLGVLLLLLVAADLVLYAHAILTHTEGWRGTPLLQKGATLVLVLWMLRLTRASE